ncbi:MAG: cupin domain-containing protein, partial [Pseudomonadota bacterium]|nr:cupin domain-containing protein [Pseudomonadota bacterium]
SIVVNPGTPEKPTRLSTQKHVGRQEEWKVAAGEATVYVGKDPEKLTQYQLKAGDRIFIPVDTRHYIANAGPSLLVFAERQSGIYLDEQDNIRRPTEEDKRTTNEPKLKLILEDIQEKGLKWPAFNPIAAAYRPSPVLRPSGTNSSLNP